MIEIKKGPVPAFLKKYRKESIFEELSTADKDSLRTELLKEQGYICAYCMKRINDYKDTKIEHYQPRNSTNQLQYSNLMIVCRGNEGSPSHLATCDTKKQNATLYLNPQNSTHIETISYTPQGIIKSSDSRIDNDLNVHLNLNCYHGYLVTNRKAVLDEFKKHLYHEGKGGKDTIPYLLKSKDKFEKLNQEGKYTEYVGIILHYINKKLKSKGIS
ncbi:HNH endonuclease [Turicibacter bilis]|uniref:HNH domain-containing protein n=1 Tax=Turicibacter bilis TaxID=2735723 RepID=A0ABY5JK56_9FIRM|nr:HNH endonuclease [Turicibacter bilis]MBS3201618.1 hypothetical protein [Turicibacter bilis]UUF07096.1 hypothetical protein J0J69_06275 [Turicibacter bilis]